MGKSSDRQTSDASLGAHLALLRKATELSLRDVEEATDREVSNAYLSQLENNKISKPSPNILHALSRVYKTSYEDLMKRAGYISDASGGKKIATFAIQGLTPEEEQELLAYLEFIRKQKRK